MAKKTNKKTIKERNPELVAAERYAPKSPAKSNIGRAIIIILCAGMVLLPLIALIISLVNE